MLDLLKIVLFNVKLSMSFFYVGRVKDIPRKEMPLPSIVQQFSVDLDFLHEGY